MCRNTAMSSFPNSENSWDASSNQESFDIDGSYINVEDRLLPEEKLGRKLYYVLSQHEIIPSLDNRKHYFYDDTTYEERLEKSSITILPPTNLKITCNISSAFRNIISSYRKSITYKVDMDLTNLHLLSKHERTLSCALYLLSTRIKKSSNIPTSAAPSHLRDSGCNEKFNYIIKHIALLIETLFANSSLHVKWDTTSNIHSYFNDDSLEQCHHDIIFSTAEGVEIGTGEIRTPNTSDELVEIDRVRVAESMKKQLHCRLKNAHHEKELFTFGMMIHGTKIELTTLNLTMDGQYYYRNVFNTTLSTAKNDYAFIEDTIEIISSLIILAENSLLGTEESQNDLILNRFIHLIKPTVYMLRSEDKV